MISAQYGLTLGGKGHFSPNAYVQGNIKGGIGRMAWRGGTSASPAEQQANAHATFYTAGAEAGIGYHLNKYLALEAVAGYQRYFKKDQLPVAANQLNNLSAGITLVGTLGLTK